LEINNLHDAWYHNYYEITTDDGSNHVFTFTTTVQQEVFIMADFYDSRMYPGSCRYGHSTGTLQLL